MLQQHDQVVIKLSAYKRLRLAVAAAEEEISSSLESSTRFKTLQEEIRAEESVFEKT